MLWLHRCFRFWDACNLKKKGDLIGFDMVLLDEKISIAAHRLNTFKNLFREGGLYELSNFDVSRSNNHFKFFDVHVCIKFAKNTNFVEAGVLAGDVSDIVLLDVTPLSIGLETLGGVMTKIIPRNSTLPTSKSEVFSTAADGQTSVEINVLQGEREFVRDNKSLGSFRLDGIPPAPRGVPQIEVKFDIDANGILSVSASDKGTGKKQDITITGASTLPKDEVEQMVQEAERFAKDDKEKRDAIDTKNQADSVVYQTEKQLKELGEKIPGEVKEKVEAKLQELKDKIGSGSTQEIKDTMVALNQEVMQIGQSMYNQPGAGAGAGSSPGGEGDSSADSSSSKGGDDVIDADFTDSN
ncbi:hypothetical protein DY000_02054226 [Brassica cretica]|uniref:Uncharacterized protein n=1 Tax=Brassica cretica TaxID=69181 RepID=A0ABQ7ADT2_BRACR|nr:hypothetical protein DY000_02054226 [Brassica cretica]